MTIRVKIFVLLLCSMLIIAGGVSIAVRMTSSKTAEEQFVLNASSQLDRVEELVKSFLQTGGQVAMALSSMPEAQQATGKLTNYTATTDTNKLDPSTFQGVEAAIFQRLDSARSLLPGVEIALLGAADGGYVKSPANTVGKGYDPRTRPWYSDALTDTKPFSITNPYISSTTKTLVTTVSAKVKDSKGQVIGVAGVDFVIGALTDVLKDARVGRSGYLLMFDRTGKVMLDPKAPANLMKPANETGDAGLADLAAQPAGILRIKRGDSELVALTRVLPDTGWKAVMVMERSEELSASNELVTNIIMVMSILALVILAGGLLISRGITRPLTLVMTQVSEVADGHFEAIDSQARSRSPEIAALQNSLRRMVGQIQELILATKSKAEEAESQSCKASTALAEADSARRAAEEATRNGRLGAAAQLEAIVRQATASAKNLQTQIKKAGKGSDDQLARTDKARSIVSDMHSTVSSIAREAAQTEEGANTTQQKAEEGSRIVSDVVKTIEEVNAHTRSLTKNLDNLGTQAQGIGQIMNVITDIADQTNLLALNAAIEAARAGEAGRGFAVVADEVRKLAEKTMTATKEVGSAVKAIQQGTADSITSMGKNGEIVNQCTELATQAGEALQSILVVARSTAEQVRGISRTSDSQADASEALTESTSEVSRIADDTAAVMHEAGRAVSEISSLVEEIRNVVEELKKA